MEITVNENSSKTKLQGLENKKSSFCSRLLFDVENKLEHDVY